MRHYEVTFIVDPVLSGDEVKATAEHIQKELKGFGATIVAVDELGLRQLAYPINKRSSGVYYCIEFGCEVADWLAKFELNMKRNERLLRFLTVKLDKYGVKYNDDKRSGRIGSKKKKEPVTATPPIEDDLLVPTPEVVDLDIE
jgi:small subunit ribosomal protein S6